MLDLGATEDSHWSNWRGQNRRNNLLAFSLVCTDWAPIAPPQALLWRNLNFHQDTEVRAALGGSKAGQYATRYLEVLGGIPEGVNKNTIVELLDSVLSPRARATGDA